MKLWIGLGMLIVGVLGAGITFVMNSSFPEGPGPVPFFAGCSVALVGLILFVSAL